MKVVICGPALPEETELLVPGASPAAAKYLRNMEAAFCKYGVAVKMFSFITAPVSEEAQESLNNTKDGHVYVAKGKKALRSLLHFRKLLKKEAKNKDNIYLFYNIGYAVWGIPFLFKLQKKKCGLILADHTNSSEEKNMIRKLIAKVAEWHYKSFSHVILLSKDAVSLTQKSAKTILLEGGLNLSAFAKCQPAAYGKEKVILYSGMLSRVTGVDLLLDAFESLNEKNISLYVTGKGELEGVVRERANSNPKIKMFGFISNEEYYKVLNTADIVVNPRNMAFEQNQNNFPSKVLEYLACGKMVLSTRFPGYEKFEDNFVFCDSNSESMSNALNAMLQYDGNVVLNQYEKNRKKAKEYSWDGQVKKIIKFLE